MPGLVSYYSIVNGWEEGSCDPLTLGKNKQAIPDYSVRPTGPKHRQRFLCELRVPGTFDYVGAGNSTNKKGKLKLFKSSSEAEVYIAIL